MDSFDTTKINQILSTMRPLLNMDGGDIELVSYQNGIVSVRLKGACATCPISLITLKMGIEERIKEYMPEVIEVVQVD